MAKRRRRPSTKQEDSTSRDSIDIISMLPDELLVYILSFLTLKEAMITSILSCRWRYLWTFTTKLDFDGTESLMKVKEKFEKGKQVRSLLVKEQGKYVRWVNHVTASLQDSTVEEFRVIFNLTKTHKRDIYKWLTYALTRKVEKLELNLTDVGCNIGPRDYAECYCFPYKLLCDSFDFNNLKKMSTNNVNVNVNGEALEFFLCNCPLLEHLSVSESGQLSSLRVTGPFPSFKRLEISSCYNLNSVEIRGATNLVYLKYEGSRIHFVLENVPQLVEVYVGGKLTHSMEDFLLLFSSYLPQLEILTFDTYDMLSWVDTEVFYSAVKMSNLKQLIVKLGIVESHTLLALTNLICAFPCLEKFVVEPFAYSRDKTLNGDLKKISRSYPCLKEVQFLGYRGMKDERELVIHFFENATALEKILIHPRNRCQLRYVYYYFIDGRNLARSQLLGKVPPRINLEIL